MKKILLIFLLIFSTYFSYSQKKIEYKIYPIDECKKDSSISQFILNLKKILIAKDTFRLFQLLDEKVVTSFGGTIYGKDGFVESWHLDKPESSDVWKSMKRIIDLGGVFDKGGVFEATSDSTIFQYPYANSNKLFSPIYKVNPDYDFDPYTTIICVKKNVPIYKGPNNKSEVAGYLSYDILAMDDEKTNEEMTNKSKDFWEWIYVSTIDKSVSGWVLDGDDFHFLGGLKLIIEKVKGEYKITGFFPYD